MILKVVQEYITLLSEFFRLSDMAASSSNQIISDGLPAFLPAGSDSLTTSHYLIKLLAEMTDCVNEVVAMDVSPEATTSLHTLLETARWKFEEALCEVWLRGECFHKSGLSIVSHRALNRRPRLLPSRNLGTTPRQSKHDPLSRPYSFLPEAHYYRGI